MNITAVIPLKANSQRLTSKNFRPFGNTTLWKLKIDVLKQVPGIRILVDSDSQDVLDMVRKYADVETRLRPAYYGTPECDNSQLFEYLGRSGPDGLIIYAPVTAPFISAETIIEALDVYDRNDVDCVVTVKEVKDHFWYEGRPVNYIPEAAENSQDLEGLYMITYGFGILKAETLEACRNIVGINTRNIFLNMDEIQAMDIDTFNEFKYCEYIYGQGICNM